jgi:hypothetical protein
MLKSEIISGGYSKLRISGITVNPTPEDSELAITTLEEMAAEYEGRNICVGYNFEEKPDVNSDSGIERMFLNAFKANLAIRLCSNFGKEPPMTLVLDANQGMSFLSSKTALVEQVPYPSRMPRGERNTLSTNRWSRYYRKPAKAPLSCKSNTMFIGDVDDFAESFEAYLDDAEFIDSYTIEADTGLTIQSDSEASPMINYRILAIGGSSETLSNLFQVKIIATTNQSRVETRIINFQIQSADI